jgi:hypothetical protein
MAQSLQFLFLASLSRAFALFFMPKATSLIFELLVTISYKHNKILLIHPSLSREETII